MTWWFPPLSLNYILLKSGTLDCSVVNDVIVKKKGSSVFSNANDYALEYDSSPLRALAFTKRHH
jgi:hypothetical protein